MKTLVKTLALSLAITASLGGCSNTNRLERVHSTAAIGAVGGYPVGAYTTGRLGNAGAGDYLIQQHGG